MVRDGQEAPWVRPRPVLDAPAFSARMVGVALEVPGFVGQVEARAVPRQRFAAAGLARLVWMMAGKSAVCRPRDRVPSGVLTEKTPGKPGVFYCSDGSV